MCIRRKNNRWYRFLFHKKYRIEIVQDIVEYYPKNRIFLIKDFGQKAWLIQFKCPCGCDSIINLNLLQDARPCWRYYIDKKSRITVRPSVHRIIGCKSHFNIINGKVIWIEV